MSQGDFRTSDFRRCTSTRRASFTKASWGSRRSCRHHQDQGRRPHSASFFDTGRDPIAFMEAKSRACPWNMTPVSTGVLVFRPPSIILLSRPVLRRAWADRRDELRAGESRLRTSSITRFAQSIYFKDPNGLSR